ncbi:hypothetical protein RFI_20308, partial [Reticulomyxa filosa]
LAFQEFKVSAEYDPIKDKPAHKNTDDHKRDLAADVDRPFDKIRPSEHREKKSPLLRVHKDPSLHDKGKGEEKDKDKDENKEQPPKRDELTDSRPLLSISKKGAETKKPQVPMVAYAPHVFRYLRTQVYGIDDTTYLKAIYDSSSSIDEATQGKFSEGKSGAFFFFTHSWTYLIKTVTVNEASLLLEILPSLVEHFETNEDTLISRYFGLYSIRMYGVQIYFMVLENIFLPVPPAEMYDIKGSWVDRHTNHFVESGKLMKDEDLHKSLRLASDASRDLAHQ